MTKTAGSRLNFHGRLVDEPEIRAGFIGCGSHSFRNIYPTFQFAPVNLLATCDLDQEKAKVFAKQFGANNAYNDYRTMLTEEELDAVFIVTSYDEKGRPLYPKLAVDCLDAGCHVWIEKPPAASVANIDMMAAAAERAGKVVVCGLKKMFFPSNVKAKELSELEEFGGIQLALVEYPQHVPTLDEFRQYHTGEKVGSVISFLDHLCHPMSLLVSMLGMPSTLYYETTGSKAGTAVFTYSDGAVANLALTNGSSSNGGMERTTLVGKSGHHIVVDNNLRVSYHRTPPGLGYGNTPSFYLGGPNDATAIWEPEMSLGQLYNKGLFLLGYYDEVNHFARCILDGTQPELGTLEHAKQVTKVFEAFAEGPGKVINLN